MRSCAKVTTPCGSESPRKDARAFYSMSLINPWQNPKPRFISFFSSFQINRDAFVRDHFYYCVLLLDVRGHLVRYADLRLAHVLQSTGHDAPTSVWKDVLLPPGHMVHPVYPHSGYTGYCRGTVITYYFYCFLFFWVVFTKCCDVIISAKPPHRSTETLSVESALSATKTTDIVLGLFWLRSAWYSLSVVISL